MFTWSLGGRRRRPCGHDLVGVHVRGGARAGLEHVDRELVVVLARGDLVAGGGDAAGQLLRRAARARLFTRAAAALMRPSICTTAAGTVSPDTGKFSTALRVSAPQSSWLKSCSSGAVPMVLSRVPSPSRCGPPARPRGMTAIRCRPSRPPAPGGGSARRAGSGGSPAPLRTAPTRYPSSGPRRSRGLRPPAWPARRRSARSDPSSGPGRRRRSAPKHSDIGVPSTRTGSGAAFSASRIAFGAARHPPGGRWPRRSPRRGRHGQPRGECSEAAHRCRC